MTTSWMTLRDDGYADDNLRLMTVPDDAPRSGHRTCSSSIENRYQTKFVITYGVIPKGHHTKSVKLSF